MALANRIIPIEWKLYRRNYIIWDHPLMNLVDSDRATRDMQDEGNPFDCFTETERDSLEDAETTLKALFNDEIMDQIRADENNFIEPGGLKFYVVETRS